MWWLIGVVIAGIIGIAKAILDSLRSEVAEERQRWETSFREKEAEVLKYEQLLNQQLALAQQTYDFNRLSELHFASIRVADSTYKLLGDARKSLDAMGNAIVSAAQARKALEDRKRRAHFWEVGKIEAEIQSLHKLRDEILTPDKNRVKAERDRLKAEVTRLNQRTAMLRDLIKDRCGRQGEQWHRALIERTDIRRRNRELASLGLPTIVLPPTLQPGSYQIDAGTVKWFDIAKGYGFITPDKGSEDLYVNKRDLHGTTYLLKGDRVQFITKWGDRGPWAAQVKKI